MHQENYSTNISIKRKSRSGEYLRWRSQVADAYRAAGMESEADLFESCSDPSHFFMLHKGETAPSDAVAVVTCPENPNHFAKGICPSCDLRTCPDCAHRNGARLLERYMPGLRKHFDNPRRGWRFRTITLTTAVSVYNEDLKAETKRLYGNVRKLFERLLKSHQNGPYTISECGLIVAHEFGPKGLKLHFHVLFYGPYMLQSKISDEWLALSGWRNIWIEEVGKGRRKETLESAVAETVKYTTKFWKRNKSGRVSYVDPAIVPIIHRALEGTRRIRSWGLFYNIAVDEEPATCPECEARLVSVNPAEHRMLLESWQVREGRANQRKISEAELHSKLANKSPPIPAMATKVERKTMFDDWCNEYFTVYNTQDGLTARLSAPRTRKQVPPGYKAFAAAVGELTVLITHEKHITPADAQRAVEAHIESALA